MTLQGEHRKLTPEEIEEFLRGDPVGLEIAPAGIHQAVRLPYTNILPEGSVTIGGGDFFAGIESEASEMFFRFIPYSVVVIGTVLGSGEFGTVHQGFLNGEAVAVKTCKSTVDVEDFKGILAEIKIMEYLGSHENVVQFLGADISMIQERKSSIVEFLAN